MTKITQNYGIKKSDEPLLKEFLRADILEYPKFKEIDEKLNEYGEKYLNFLFEKIIKEAKKSNKKNKVSKIEILSFGNLKNIQRRLVLPAENFDWKDFNILIELCTCGCEECWGKIKLGICNK